MDRDLTRRISLQVYPDFGPPGPVSSCTRLGAAIAARMDNPLRSLGMQAAVVLPLSMPLLVPVGHDHLNWFFPALTILLGAA